MPKKRLALINCEAPTQEPMPFRGKLVPAAVAIHTKFTELGLETVMHKPVSNPRDLPDLDRFHGLAMGGSSLNISDEDLKKHEWMRRLLDLLRSVKIPAFGICFGHQAIGRMLGAPLYRYNGFYEVGFSKVRLTQNAANDPLFQGLPYRFHALFSHFSYLKDVPGAVPLAYSSDPANPSLQAFRYKDNVWGVQYHPEFSVEGILAMVRSRQEKIRHIVDVDLVVQDLEQGKPRFDDQLFSRFASLL